MSWKLNLFLSIGSLLPLFSFSLIVSMFIVTGFSFFISSLLLFTFSICINLYILKYISEKKEFNPKQFKVVSAKKESGFEYWITLTSIIADLVSLLFARLTNSILDQTIMFLGISFVFLIILTSFIGEELIAQIISVRFVYPKIYVVTIKDADEIYVMSKEKIHANSEFKAFSLAGDFFLFGYPTS